MTDDPYKDVSQLGQITSLTSDEDGGYPDVGIIVGLGDGASLYVGEVSAATAGASEFPGRWRIALHRDGKGFQVAGLVSDEFNAREMVDLVFAAIQAAIAKAAPSQDAGQ